MLNSDDLKIEFLPPSKSGGMKILEKVNGIKITHKPTGLIAISDTEKNQHLNKEKAMKLLSEKLRSNQ